MTLFEFLSQLNPYVFIFSIISLTFVITYVATKGIELTSKKGTLKIFNKKNNSIESALIIEKIIEIAYEITYERKEKKIKNQMIYSENIFEEILNNYEKKFRNILERTLQNQGEKTFNLEDHPDLIIIKSIKYIIFNDWKNKSRFLFRDLFERIEKNQNDDLEDTKRMFISALSKIREEVINLLYKDGHTYKKVISCSELNFIIKEDNIKVEHSLKDIINHSKTIHEKVKIEETKKRKELENFLKENLL